MSLLQNTARLAPHGYGINKHVCAGIAPSTRLPTSIETDGGSLKSFITPNATVTEYGLICLATMLRILKLRYKRPDVATIVSESIVMITSSQRNNTRDNAFLPQQESQA